MFTSYHQQVARAHIFDMQINVVGNEFMSKWMKNKLLRTPPINGDRFRSIHSTNYIHTYATINTWQWNEKKNGITNTHTHTHDINSSFQSKLIEQFILPLWLIQRAYDLWYDWKQNVSPPFIHRSPGILCTFANCKSMIIDRKKNGALAKIRRTAAEDSKKMKCWC